MGHPESGQKVVTGPGGMTIEVSYFRSLEGILRIVAIVRSYSYWSLHKFSS